MKIFCFVGSHGLLYCVSTSWLNGLDRSSAVSVLHGLSIFELSLTRFSVRYGRRGRRTGHHRLLPGGGAKELEAVAKSIA